MGSLPAGHRHRTAGQLGISPTKLTFMIGQLQLSASDRMFPFDQPSLQLGKLPESLLEKRNPPINSVFHHGGKLRLEQDR